MEPNTTIELTEASRKMFEQIVKDLGNWGGNCSGNYDYFGERKGNLTDLKKKGLVTTFNCEDTGAFFVEITNEGREYARTIGLAEHL